MGATYSLSPSRLPPDHVLSLSTAFLRGFSPRNQDEGQRSWERFLSAKPKSIG